MVVHRLVALVAERFAAGPMCPIVVLADREHQLADTHLDAHLVELARW